jgi:hypothetical protein
MARNFIAAVLLLAAIAGINAQTAPTVSVMPVAETPTTMPGPMVISAGPGAPMAAPVAVVPAAAPLPTREPYDPNLLVKPEEVQATMAFLDTVYKANPNVQTACLADKIMVSKSSHLLIYKLILFLTNDPTNFVSQLFSFPLQTDYYALSVINCDRAQSNAAPGVPVTACPEACRTGVTLAGADCVAAMNLAYIKSTAASDGSQFAMPDFDPTGTLAACNVVVDDAAKATAYEVGQSIYLTQALQKAGVSVPECGDFSALQTDSFAQSKTKCAAAPDCSADCQAAITAAGDACLKALATATSTADPAQYAAQLQVFEKCDIKPSVTPIVVPVPAGAPSRAPVPTPVAPVSSATSVSVAAGVAAGVAAAAMLLL